MILRRRKNIFTQSWVRLNLTKPWHPFPLFKFVLLLFLGPITLNLSPLWRLFFSRLWPGRAFRPLAPSGLELPTNSVVTFLSPISPLSKIPSNPASPDEPPFLTLLLTSLPPTLNPDVAPSTSICSQFSISSPEASQSENTQELPPFSSFLSDVRPFLSRTNHLKLQLDQSASGRQHRRECYTNDAGRSKRPRFDQNLQYCLKPEFCKWEIIFWDSRRQEYTIQSTSFPSERLVVPRQAITALLRWCR